MKNEKEKFALAVSGGVDSMVMLHIFASQTPRLDFFVVTINHNIRKEGASDCLFVENYCKKLGVECRVFSVDVPSYCKQHNLSEETAARILRYRVLDNLDCDYVCLAHQADDNAETVLMHIVRGSGAYGAEGIRREGKRYLRPILGMTRKDVLRYAEKFDVPFVTDSTNSDTKYARNYIRHEILPRLATLNGNVAANINRFAENIAEDNAFLDELADVSSVTFTDEGAQIPSELLLQPRPVAYRVLRKVFHRLGVWYDVKKPHYDAIIALAENNGGKKLSLPFDLIAINDYNRITITPRKESVAWDFEVPFSVGSVCTPVGTALVTEEVVSDSLQFDIAKIPATAVFRTRRSGDVFRKFGGGGKSLGRYLIDKKVPARFRDKLLLVADGNNVLIVCGVEISDDVKVENNSQRYFIKVT